MTGQHPNHAASTAAAKVALERVRNNWEMAREAGQKPEPYFYDGQAKGIFDLWADLTGVNSAHPDYQALMAKVRETTKR